jgi:hypothetical protein
MLVHQKQKLQGAIIGLVAPILSSPLVCFLLFYFGSPKKIDERGYATGTYHYADFYWNLLTNPTRLPIFISLCTLINLAVFSILLKQDKDWIARGMIYTTLLYAAIYFILKLG